MFVFVFAAALGVAAGCDNTTTKRPPNRYPPQEPEPERQAASCEHVAVVPPSDVLLEPSGRCPPTLPELRSPCLEPALCVSSTNADDPADPGWAAECTGNGSSEGVWLIYRGVEQPAGESVCGRPGTYGLDDYWLRFAEGTRQGSFAYEATDASVFLAKRGGRFYYFGHFDSLDDGGSLVVDQASLEEESCTLTLATSGQCKGSRGECAFTGSVSITIVPDAPYTATFQQACAGVNGGQRSGGVGVASW